MKEKKLIEKTNRTIESLFRDQRIEIQVAAYVLRENPSMSHLVSSSWFSCVPIGKIVRLVQRVGVVMAESTLPYQLKSKRVVKNKDEMEVFALYIQKLFSCNVCLLRSDGVKLLIQQLYELYESRQCLQGIKSVLANLKAFDLLKVKNEFRRLGQPLKSLDSDKEGDYLQDFETRAKVIQERAEKSDKEEMIGIPTGIVRFDWLIGGVMPGEFGVVAGEPAIGKTATLICFAIYAWLAGYNVLFASGEMAKYGIQFRIDAHLAGISAQKFRTGNFDKKDFAVWRAKVDALRSMMTSFFEVVAFPRDFSMEQVRDKALQVQEKHGAPIHVVFTDYINIVVPNELFGSGKDWKNQADVVWDFKEFVADFNGGIAGWTAGQIRDEYVGKNELKLDALKYSRAISETAPIVVGLVRTEDDVLYNTMQLQVLKMRNAPPPKRPILLHPNLDIMRIHQEISSKKNLLMLEDEVIQKKKALKERKRGGRKSLRDNI